MTWEQVLTLRALIVLDAAFLSNAARRQIMNFLIDTAGYSADAGWSTYQRSIRWWSVRAPVIYLLISGVARYVMDLDFAGSVAGAISGGIFLASICMSLASAMRLLPLAKRFETPTDWTDFERSLSATDGVQPHASTQT